MKNQKNKDYIFYFITEVRKNSEMDIKGNKITIQFTFLKCLWLINDWNISTF